MGFSRKNALNQALDIAGSFTQTQTLTEAEEFSGYGAPLTGQTGTGAAITTVLAGIATVTTLTGMTLQSVGNMLTISNAVNAANNGTWLIVTFNSATSVDISNTAAVASDPGLAGGLSWTERQPYCLEDDINYTRTDRKKIKGTTNWYDAIPTYQRPTAIGTFVPADLTNIATKTTDAIAYNVNRAYFGEAVTTGNTLVTVTSAGNLKHADAVNLTGVPVFDTGPFAGDYTSCYVHVVDGYADGYAGSELSVLTGPYVGERIFGVTYNGSSTSPNSVEVHFYSAAYNVNYAVSPHPYTWEFGQPQVINLLYGYNERLDQLDQNAFRTVPALGILTDAALAGNINNILQTVGINPTTTNLGGLLTNTTSFFPFFNLNATPTVVDALNILNQQIGNTTFTGPYLVNNATVTANLQALSNAITGSTVTRTIERLAANITANTAHTLPGGISYVLDGTNNGLHLWTFVRGVLRDPGPVATGNDYAETSTTSITFYAKVNANDHINYFIRA
jgi:hypothetical protein